MVDAHIFDIASYKEIRDALAVHVAGLPRGAVAQDGGPALSRFYLNLHTLGWWKVAPNAATDSGGGDETTLADLMKAAQPCFGTGTRRFPGSFLKAAFMLWLSSEENDFIAELAIQKRVTAARARRDNHALLAHGAIAPVLAPPVFLGEKVVPGDGGSACAVAFLGGAGERGLTGQCRSGGGGERELTGDAAPVAAEEVTFSLAQVQALAGYLSGQGGGGGGCGERGLAGQGGYAFLGGADGGGVVAAGVASVAPGEPVAAAATYTLAQVQALVAILVGQGGGGGGSEPGLAGQGGGVCGGLTGAAAVTAPALCRSD